MPVIVELSKEQMQEAADAAKRLHDMLRARGARNAHGLRDEDATADLEAGGAAAELAVSVYLGVRWAGAVGNSSYGPDVGERTQVRSSNRPRKHHCLIVRQRDIDKYGNVPFVLVIQEGNRFEIKGWAWAQDAVRRGRFSDGGDKDRPKAWFLGEEFLRPIEDLEDA